MKDFVRVRVPASTANLGPGYDVLGLAFQFYNELQVRLRKLQGKNSGPEVRIEIQGEGAGSLPRGQDNVIWRCMSAVLRQCKFPLRQYRFEMKCVNRIPLARGLGSSAAAGLSGILAANAICGNPLKQEQVLGWAVKVEGHPDNVVPQLVGGLCASGMFNGRVEFVRLRLPQKISAVVCVPEFTLSTKKARAALPQKIAHADAVFNVSRAALLLGALANLDSRRIRLAMDDRLHQPYRKKLVPGFDAVVKRAYAAGAWGVALSGAGPSMLALAPPARAGAVGRAMEKGFAQAGHGSKSLVLQFDQKGAVVG